jgi:hypothetical protein
LDPEGSENELNETKVFTRSFISNLMKLNSGTQSASKQKKTSLNDAKKNNVSSRNEARIPLPNKVASP